MVSRTAVNTSDTTSETPTLPSNLTESDTVELIESLEMHVGQSF